MKKERNSIMFYLISVYREIHVVKYEIIHIIMNY